MELLWQEAVIERMLSDHGKVLTEVEALEGHRQTVKPVFKSTHRSYNKPDHS